MSPRRTLLAALILSLLMVATTAAPSAHAQSPDPPLEVSVSFGESTVNIGDRVELLVQVRHPEDVLITVPRPPLADGEALADGQVTSTAQADGSFITTTTFPYQLFGLGRVETGAITVRWLREDGTRGELVAGPGALSVVPVRAPGDEALRPLKPQLHVAGAPAAWLRPVAGVGVALTLVGLAAAAAWWWRHRPRKPLILGPSDVPERSARERLEALRNLPLAGEAEFQHYYGTIAAVVRGYLGDRFGFNAAALTTHELERRMTSHGVDRWQARLVSGLLDRCDHAVYARRYPDPASADHDLTVAYEIVELSRPAGASETAEAVAVS